MKNPLIIIFLNFIFCFSCNSQDEESVVKQFITAYNQKDSIKTFALLHKDFQEVFDEDFTIKNKNQYAKNYSWGKVMNDKMEFEITKISNNKIETLSTYYSDRDSILEVSPYKSLRTYIVQDNQIIKIIENKHSGYDKYDNPRREKYRDFFEWLLVKHKLTISDFEFSEKGARKLKPYLIGYSEKK